MRLLLPFCLAMVPCAASAAGFTLTSPSFPADGTLARAQVNGQARCGHGGDLSPALLWDTPPAGTRSLAVSLFDPDARDGKGWWHWALFDLPPDLRALPEGVGTPAKTPQGAREATNSFGVVGYGGACPPPGDPPHRYVFTLYAIGETRPPFDAGSQAAAVGAWLGAHAIGKAQVTARYGR